MNYTFCEVPEEFILNFFHRVKHFHSMFLHGDTPDLNNRGLCYLLMKEGDHPMNYQYSYIIIEQIFGSVAYSDELVRGVWTEKRVNMFCMLCAMTPEDINNFLILE